MTTTVTTALRRSVMQGVHGPGVVLGVTFGLLVTLSRPTNAQTSAHLAKGPYLQDLGSTSVEVRAELDLPLPASVTLTPKATDAGGAPRTVRDSVASTMHVLRVDGLVPSTRYSYSFNAGPSVATGELTTAPPPSSTDPFTFLIYGDNRSDDVAHAAIVRAMLKSPSDFVVNTGDYVQDGAVDSLWQSFFEVEAPLIKDRCVFACVGNHELVDGAGTSYLRYFGPVSDSRGDGEKPKLYGSFRWGDARFFLLDAMESFADGPERAWLDDELTRTDAEHDVKWRIAVLHHSPWSAGPHGGNRRMLSAGVPALLAQHHIDLIVAGHDHIYERGFASGIAYLVSGGGGAPLYPVDQPIPSTRKVESVHHFVEAVVSVDAIRILAKRDDGSVLDRCGFLKATGQWDCDPKPSVASTTSSAVPDPPPPVPSKCACDVLGRTSRGAPAWFAGLALASLAWVRRRNRG